MGYKIQGVKTRVVPLTITTGNGNTGIYCVEASDTAKHPKGEGQSSSYKVLSSPKC